MGFWINFNSKSSLPLSKISFFIVFGPTPLDKIRSVGPGNLNFLQCRLYLLGLIVNRIGFCGNISLDEETNKPKVAYLFQEEDIPLTFPSWTLKFTNLSHLLVTFACSANFYIYFIKYSTRNPPKMKNLDGFFGKHLAIFQSQRSTYNSQDEENDLELEAQWVKISEYCHSFLGLCIKLHFFRNFSHTSEIDSFCWTKPAKSSALLDVQ